MAAGERKPLVIFERIGKIFKRSEQVVGPKERRIDSDSGGGLATLGIAHCSEAGTDFFRGILNRQMPTQACFTEIGSQFLERLFDGVGLGFEERVSAQGHPLKADYPV
jgi:hypothetical protein